MNRVFSCGVATLVGAAALATLATSAGCSTHTSAISQVEPANSVTEAQRPVAREERAHELVRVADVQIRDMQDSRAAARDLQTISVIDRQIVTISRYRDLVLADLGGIPPAQELDIDVSNLERSMQFAALTAPQAPLPPPPLLAPRRSVPDLMRPGGYIAYPPNR